MQRVDPRVQLGQVLPLLQLLEEIALRAFLPVREGGQDAMLLEQSRDVLERLIQSAVWRGEGHGPLRIRQAEGPAAQARAASRQVLGFAGGRDGRRLSSARPLP